MKKPLACVWTVVLALAGSALPARASDHADPIELKNLEAGLTDLFFFPHGDQMILILATRRALTAAAPYDLSPYELTVYMDLHSRLSFDRPADVARYGGTVVDPTGISPDVTLRFRLNDDATLAGKTFEGLADAEAIQLYTGVRDDPFIFPRFFKKNTIAMVLSIPMTSFPAGQQDWLLWGTSTKDGKQIDHVGRSNRTQLARFDFLNTVPPSQHVAAIREMEKTWAGRVKFLNRVSVPISNLVTAVFAIRNYDLVPDVMVYTSRFPSGYPNGRRLPDDVVDLICQIGDCLLFEASFQDSEAWPRQTVNDKEFLPDFPFLAEPWPEAPQAKMPSSLVLPLVLGLIAVVVLILWILCRLCTKRALRRLAR